MNDDALPDRTTASPRRGWVHWPAVAASALLAALVAALMYRGAVLNGGQMTYSVDDTYLHMALAKNLARRGVWGFSILDGFNSSDSSLLWPALLALCNLGFGDRQITSLLLNVAASSAALFYAAFILRRFAIGGWRSFLILGSIVLFVPLPAMISTGMEHSLQILIVLAFVDTAVSLLADDASPRLGQASRSVLLLGLGGALTSVRYEGLFLIGIVGLLLWCRRRWTLGVLLGVAAGTPLALFGLWSMRHGWYALPNSILLKGNTTATLSPVGVLLYVTTGLRRLAVKPHLLILTAGLAAVLVVEWRRRRTLWTSLNLFLTITLGVVALHLQFADTGWFYRYEAYLMTLSLLVLGIWLVRELPAGDPAVVRGSSRRWPGYAAALAAGVAVACVVLGGRAARGLGWVPIACHNIYEQQYQMGRFLRRCYNGQGVAANDIGAIDYLADIRLFDTFGLANVDVLRARRAHAYDHTVVERLMQRYDVQVVIAYYDWTLLYGGILPTWTPVGQWTLPDNVVCAEDTVTFYAPSAALVPAVTRHLQEFAPLLPPYIRQSGLYCGGPAPHVTGTYNRTLDAAHPYYRAAYSASFFVYPLPGQPASMERDAVLTLDVQPLGKDLHLDVVVDGRSAGGKDFPASAPGVAPRTAFAVPVQLHGGMNDIRLIGRGTPGRATVDNVPVLFDVGEPGWTLAADRAPATPAAVGSQYQTSAQSSSSAP